jgi:two-component system OmpR family response regulator
MKISKVLLVDDEPDIRRIAELSLRAVGKWDVSLASSGAEALTVAASYQPDVILLDMMMPGMDGVTALAQLRAQPETAHIPVIFVTAKVQRQEVAEYLALGALGVVTKPFDPMALPAEMRRLVEKVGP